MCIIKGCKAYQTLDRAFGGFGSGLRVNSEGGNFVNQLSDLKLLKLRSLCGRNFEN